MCGDQPHAQPLQAATAGPFHLPASAVPLRRIVKTMRAASIASRTAASPTNSACWTRPTMPRCSGPCCAPGSARTRVSRGGSCRPISAFSSSCTTLGAAAKLSSAPLSPLWSFDGRHRPGSRQEPSALSLRRPAATGAAGCDNDGCLEVFAVSIADGQWPIRQVVVTPC